MAASGLASQRTVEFRVSVRALEPQISHVMVHFADVSRAIKPMNYKGVHPENRCSGEVKLSPASHSSLWVYFWQCGLSYLAAL